MEISSAVGGVREQCGLADAVLAMDCQRSAHRTARTI
jgi:hypothetical protein